MTVPIKKFLIPTASPKIKPNGKPKAVRWDDAGFTVGAEVKLSVPSSPVTYSELSVLAKCDGRLDSIGEKPKAGRKKKTESGGDAP